MPSVADLRSKNALVVYEKHLDLLSHYQTHQPSLQGLYNLALSKIVNDVAESLQLSDEGKGRVGLYLSDFANLFRFYRRARYDREKATGLLTASVLWRMRTDLDMLSLSGLDPLYVTPPEPNPPLFWVNSGFKDFYGRPCGVISLRSVERTEDNSLDRLKEYIVACMEILRRYIADLYRTNLNNNETYETEMEKKMVIQAVIAVDLEKSGMANLELELLPFLLDLLKNHVPGMVGAVYVLNYGWVHAGMWAVIKRVLPQQALAKIFFPKHEELREHFDAKNIPSCYGGELDVVVESGSNDVLWKYGRPRRVSGATPPHSPGPSRHMSRTNSYDSIYEVFYSADSTPWASRSITPRHSEPSTPRGNHSSSGSLKMTPSAARKLKHLQMSRGDLSSAAEHAHPARPGLDPRIVDGRAVGLSVSVGSSPFVTPSMTPVGPLSPRVVRTRNSERHVRFSTHPDRKISPQTRLGTTNNFTLYLPQQDEEALLASESEDSDASGKDGELPPIPTTTSGILTRLRRLSEPRLPTKKSSQDTKDAESSIDDGTIMYIEPSSPRLQVAHLEEEPLQHVPHTFLSHRTRRSARDGLVSPYNANNPFFGYPAYNPTTEAMFRLHRATPQHLHSRRRKRDLLRTLTYLFVLRILALHRRFRWRMGLVWREVVRTVCVGVDVDRGDEFWRNLDASRLSAIHHNEQKRQGKKVEREGVLNVVRKLMGAVGVVMLLRPEWRRRMVVRVYSAFASREEGGTVDGKEWENRGVATAKRTRSGLNIRRRLGFQPDGGKVHNAAVVHPSVSTAAGSGGGKQTRGSKLNPIAIAGGIISAASLGYLLYTYFSTSKDSDDDDVSRHQPPTKPSKTDPNRPRPSLSLSLSPTFTRDTASITNLRTLLTTISPHYIIHLILPGNPTTDITTSITTLTNTLGPIPTFDPRRILEYTHSTGRFALSRALSCDCHVEISLPRSDESATLGELGKIRRSCGMVVFASFDSTSGGIVLDGLRSLVEEGSGRDAPNGMRVLDLSSTESKWSALAEWLVELRSGWK